MRRISIVSVAVAVAAFVLLFWGRHYPWQLALLTALAIGALTFSVQRTLQHMRGLTARGQPIARPSGTTRPFGVRSPGDQAPWKREQRAGEQQMGWPARHQTGQEQDQPDRKQRGGQQEPISR